MPDIRQLYEKDFLGQWDCTDQDMVLTIKKVTQEEIPQPKTNKKTVKVCLSFTETEKKMVLNATNRDIIALNIAKTWDYTKWPGVRIQLYKDAKVRFGMDEVGGLRVRKTPPATESVFCDECGQEIQAAAGMTPAQVAAYTRKKYGKALCAECAQKAKEAKDAAAE